MSNNEDTGKPLVLVVDDDLTNRVMVRAALQKAGFAVELAEHGREAMEVFAKRTPQIVLLDIMMPVMNGYEVLRALRDDPSGRHVPIVMMTSMDDTDSVKEAYKLGATDFVIKPVNHLLLTYRLEHVLEASITANELRKSQARVFNAQRIARLGHWEWDPATNAVFCSEGIRDIFGVSEIDPFLRLEKYLECVYPQDRQLVRDAFEQSVREQSSFNLDHRLVLADGSLRNLHHECKFSSPDAGSSVTAISTVQDVTERRQAEQEIHFLAHFDKLTSLPNRGLFTEHLQQAITVAKRRQKETIVLFLDLDRFNRFNESLGHASGDELLKLVAERLSSSVRESDLVARDQRSGESLAEVWPEDGTVARFGGDEFVILLTNVNSAENAIYVVKRVKDALERPFRVAGQELYVTASIGVSAYPLDGDRAELLLKHAEVAMTHAKRRGRNQLQFYTSSLNSRTRKKFAIETELRKALDCQELEVHFQPKVNISDDRVQGVEALARWPRGGELAAVPPTEFIPVAEETGLILPLSEWVLATACAQAAEWHRAGHDALSLSVNLSAAQFRQPQIGRVLTDIQESSGLRRESVELELTESLLFEDSESSIEILRELRAAGFQIALDDFGTGYSSYYHLKRFPLNSVKIDKSFVHNVATDSKDSAIVKSIIVLGHNLGLTVTAEGVQDERQLANLRAHRCDCAQGYYYAPALSGAQFGEWLQARDAGTSAGSDRAATGTSDKLVLY